MKGVGVERDPPKSHFERFRRASRARPNAPRQNPSERFVRADDIHVGLAFGAGGEPAKVQNRASEPRGFEPLQL